MARYKLSYDTALKPSSMSKIIDKSGKKIFAGTISDRLTSPDSSKIMRVSQKMMTNGTLEPTAIRAPDQLSQKILSAMGCSVVVAGPTSNKDYTLISDQIDTEVVENPNKTDLNQLIKIEKQKITIDHIFNNENDSIFKLDEAIPHYYQQDIKKNYSAVKQPSAGDITNIVIKAIDLSLNTPNEKAVRAFMEI